MVSEKAKRILLSKSDLTREEVEKLTEAEAWRLIYSINAPKKKPPDNRPQICFTGFSASQKAELAKIAESHGFKVVSSVTKNLRFLCCGENAGPQKVAQAESQGVTLLNESRFFELIKKIRLERGSKGF